MTKSFSEISARYRLRSGTVCALRTGARCVQSQPYCLATTRPERRRCQGCGRSPHPKGMALKTPECRAPSRSSRRADRRSCGSSPSRRVTITTSNPVITLTCARNRSWCWCVRATSMWCCGCFDVPVFVLKREGSHGLRQGGEWHLPERERRE